MQKIINPYTPGAGVMPGYLAGRDDIIQDGKDSIYSLMNGYPRQPIIYYGLRGVGKTVLLTALKEYAIKEGVLAFHFEIQEKVSLINDIILSANQTLTKISKVEKIKNIFEVAKNSLQSFTLTYTTGENSISVEMNKKLSEMMLQSNLVELLLNLGRLAKESKNTIIYFIDEIQYAKQNELEALITAQHRINQERLPITIIAAGLPKILVNMTESKTYAERMFAFIEISSLEYKDAKNAIVNPGKPFDITYTEEALKEIYQITEGYPYFIQQFCYLISKKYKDIDLNIVNEMKSIFFKELDKSFFKVRFDKCTPREKEFMFAMANCGELPCTVASVAHILNKDLKSISPIRARLINKGLIYATRYGEIDFTVPKFDEFLKRMKLV
ncbi:AAA family ATPase [Fusobacterium perfoetens]|uniref:AAA family ATPase n=1 Tax=Fusobacterium perfoetens TaxID=852 RepID=UPI001F2B2890|nr:ATP-binding protein [Fusobacterium perfoetens]MCF2611912.1 AAA family ATPase [Fusobacterium perfoetens]